MRFTFSKNEILRKKKDIKELFENGSSFFIHPFKVLYLPYPAEKHHKVIFTVSRRTFKRAVDRNLVKRRIRECYRLNKYILQDNRQAKLSFSIAIIYIGKNVPDFAYINGKIIVILKKLSEISQKIS
ncbi:MAG: ribonuclease P protein component [Cyclobacteriaceae bacterium]|nr:ribonuclease P protein component [Cyclobacteriaceae bacterium]